MNGRAKPNNLDLLGWNYCKTSALQWRRHPVQLLETHMLVGLFAFIKYFIKTTYPWLPSYHPSQLRHGIKNVKCYKKKYFVFLIVHVRHEMIDRVKLNKN